MSNTVADKLAKKTRKKAPSKQVRLKLVYIDFWSAVKMCIRDRCTAMPSEIRA